MSINPISMRMLSQRLAGSLFSTPEEVVTHFGAMQAQDYRMMRWAVAMRTAKASPEAFSKAFDGGLVIRLHLLRGTWQLVGREDYWWMLRLCAPKSERAVLVDAADAGGSVNKEDFASALAERGIVMDEHRLSYHIKLAELSGTLCSGKLEKRKATYALAEKQAGPEPPAMDRDEALARLGRAYFRSHAPATLEDFVWWSGLGTGDCRRAVSVLGTELRVEKFAGREFLVHESCRTRGFRKGNLVLLPPYDEYLVGYKSRDIVLDGNFSYKAHNKTGIFYPVILYDGRVCGNWKPSDLSVEFFDADTSAIKKQGLRFPSESLL